MVIDLSSEQMPKKIVEFDNVVIAYDNFPAIAGATFTVNLGEIVLLQGANGAGKSTLLRACAGLVPITRGTASVLGCDLVKDRNSVRSRVGLVGHANGLFQDLTVVENLEFWSRLVGSTKSDVDQAMQAIGLGGRLGKTRVSRLSAGQKRRCALANLIIRRAQLWLLDEPHAGLDLQGRIELDLILRSATNSGATIIFASHELDRANKLATRSLNLLGGVVKSS